VNLFTLAVSIIFPHHSYHHPPHYPGCEFPESMTSDSVRCETAADGPQLSLENDSHKIRQNSNGLLAKITRGC
jgi:hypothetical protein